MRVKVRVRVRGMVEREGGRGLPPERLAKLVLIA